MSNSDDYARAVIAEGQRRNITPRGIVIALATVLVESGSPIRMWANSKVPESLSLPHDAVGSDGYSVGLFQQQVRKGNGGQWWWGDAQTCMNPTLSAGLFYDRLAKRDYNHGDPGAHAQAIQQSAYPDRYAQRMAEAQAIYDRLSGAPVDPNRPAYNEFPIWSVNHYNGRNGVTVDMFILHTSEGFVGNDAAAEGLSKWYEGPSAGVAYHYAVSQASDGGVTVVDNVDTDDASWSALSANNRSINLCFAGTKAAWSRDDWLTKFGNAIDVAAYLAVQDCRKYKIPTKIVAPPYNDRIPGITDHRYVTKVLGGGSHTDVGDGFPWDVFAAAVAKYSGTQTPAPPAVKQWPKDYSDRELLEYIAAQLGPGDPAWQSKGMTLRDRVWSLGKDA